MQHLAQLDEGARLSRTKELIRQDVYAELLATERMDLHRAVGDAVERLESHALDS